MGASGRRTHHPAQAHICGETLGDNGRQGEKRPRGGRRTIQQMETRRETMGDKGRQGLGNADTPSWQWETRREGPGLRPGFFPPCPGIFSPSITHQFPRYLQHVKPRSCHFDNICSILELLLRFLQYFAARFFLKSSIVELETFFAGIIFFLELAAIWGWFS